jgi:hypothetical protein
MKYIKHLELPSELFINGKQCKFFWCPLCEVVTIHFPCCKNSSCNCGGCEHCTKIDLSKVQFPTKEQLIEVKEYISESKEAEIQLLDDIMHTTTEIFED